MRNKAEQESKSGRKRRVRRGFLIFLFLLFAVWAIDFKVYTHCGLSEEKAKEIAMNYLKEQNLPQELEITDIHTQYSWPTFLISSSEEWATRKERIGLSWWDVIVGKAGEYWVATSHYIYRGYQLRLRGIMPVMTVQVGCPWLHAYIVMSCETGQILDIDPADASVILEQCSAGQSSSSGNAGVQPKDVNEIISND